MMLPELWTPISSLGDAQQDSRIHVADSVLSGTPVYTWQTACSAGLLYTRVSQRVH